MPGSSAADRRRIRELEAEIAVLRERATKADSVLAASREAMQVVELKLDQTEGALWQLSQLITYAGIPIVIADPFGCITDLNHEAEIRWGKTRGELLGASLEDIVPATRHHVLEEMLAECRGGNRVYDVEKRLWGNREGASQRSSWLMLSPIHDREGEVTGVVLAEDLREVKATGALLEHVNEELKHLALVDGLTQLGNRRQFERAFAREMASAARHRRWLSLAMIDVDYFKPYNDALGHPAGDTCLVAVGRRIKRCVRRPADLVARYGGEEFAALLPDTEPEGAGALAEQIRAGVETLHVAHPSSPVSAFVTVSVGVATVRVAPGLARRALLHAADRALYRAKETGRNRIYATELPSEQAAMGE